MFWHGPKGTGRSLIRQATVGHSLPQAVRILRGNRDMAVEGSVPLPGIIVPHLVVRDAAEAVEFYIEAFRAKVLYRSPSPSGIGEHVHLKVWNSLIQVSTEE